MQRALEARLEPLAPRPVDLVAVARARLGPELFLGAAQPDADRLAVTDHVSVTLELPGRRRQEGMEADEGRHRAGLPQMGGQ